jgi:streptomycin 6-kinase
MTGPLHRGLAWLSATEAGAAWLGDLPRLVAECATRWSLDVGEPFTDANVSLVLAAQRVDGSPAVLKLQFPHRESEFEAAALARWGGRGAVRLLAHDPARRALLLERCRPGTPLSAAGPDEALAVLGGLVDRLSVAAGHRIGTLAEEADRWRDGLAARWARAGRPCPRPLVDAAAERLAALAPTQGAPVLVHQDLHSGNVLAARREPWLAIDPKPLAGEREFAVAPVVRDAALGHRPELVLRRLDALVDRLGLDGERARGWALAQAVAWGFDGDAPSRRNLEVAAWLFARDP